MICKKCSATLPDDGLFCPICGSRADGNKTCPKCDKLIPENSIFCTYCGAKVGEVSNDSPVAEKESAGGVAPAVIPVPVATDAKDDNTGVEDSAVEDDKTEEDVPTIQGIVCTQCGSGNIELISEDMGKCKNCGTQILINKQKDTNVVTNNVNVYVGENSGEKSISFYMLPKEVSANEFYANALTEIALDKNTPADIFQLAKFSPVKTEYRQYLLGKGTADMTYSATVGYDRKETYYEKQRDYDRERRMNDGRQYFKDVQKTRTVTDWKPFSGTHKGEYVGSVPNGDNAKTCESGDYESFCLKKAVEYSADSGFPAPLPPSDRAIEGVKSSIKISAEFACKRQLPGDRNKDFRADGTVELSRIESHVAPQYVLNYKYLGVDYGAHAHSVKESLIKCKSPSARSEIENEIENKVLVKSFNIATLSSLVLSILASILFPLALKIIFGILAIGSFVTYWIIRSKTSKNVYNEKLTKKKTSLIALLKSKGIKVPEKLKAGL